MIEEDEQRAPGLLQPCCIFTVWAVQCGWIKKGYMWHRDGKPIWIPWTLKVQGTGWIETGPIHFCPSCGKNLDEPED